MLSERVQEVLKELSVSDEQLRLISDKMIDEFELGLEFGKTATSSIAMLPSYVPELPDGSGEMTTNVWFHSFAFVETGKYIAIDLSGKNLRIMLMELRQSADYEVHTNNYMVHASVMKGTGDQVK